MNCFTYLLPTGRPPVLFTILKILPHLPYLVSYLTPLGQWAPFNIFMNFRSLHDLVVDLFYPQPLVLTLLYVPLYHLLNEALRRYNYSPLIRTGYGMALF